jgi:hypothetical protein
MSVTAVSVSYISQVTVTETFTDQQGQSGPFTHTTMNTVAALNSSSTPPVSEDAPITVTLSSGVATVDLTNLPGTSGTVNGTGLKIQLFKVQNPSTNTHPIVFKTGASNGYAFRGSSWQETLQPGEEMTYLGCNSSSVPAIASGAKTIDFNDASAGSSQSVLVLIVMG